MYTERCNFYMQSDEKAKLAQIAKDLGVSRSGLVRMFVINYDLFREQMKHLVNSERLNQNGEDFDNRNQKTFKMSL